MSNRDRKPGMTLIELLVAIAIMIVLMTLVVVYVVPAFSDNKNVIRGLDRVTTVLLIAKQRALRDGRPVGVRFDMDGGICRTMRYVEQAEPLVGAQVSIAAGGGATFTGVDLFGGGTTMPDYAVQPGDWLRLDDTQNGAGPNFEIVGVTGQTTASLRNPPAVPVTSTRFRIIRGVRPMAEDAVEMPLNVVVNIGAVSGYPAYTQNQVPLSISGHYQVVFDASGNVINALYSSPIVLWVHDETKQATDSNTARCLGINPRTGQISAHEINPIGNDPLQFARDGKASGL